MALNRHPAAAEGRVSRWRKYRMIPDNPHPWRAWWLCRVIHNFHLRMTHDHRVLDNLVARVAALEQFNLNYEIVEPEPMRSDVPR